MTQEEIITKAVLEAIGKTDKGAGKKASGMTLDIAKRLIEKVENKAREWDMRVVIAVSDDRGKITALHSMDGAYHGSYDVAVNKCYTATAFQMPTSELSKLCAPGGELYGLQFSNEGKVMILGGGVPLYDGSVMIGALGVSGSTAKLDTALSEYGYEIFKSCLNGK